MNLQLTVKNANVDFETGTIFLEDVDADEVLSELSVKEKLDSVDKGDILDYLHQLTLDEE